MGLISHGTSTLQPRYGYTVVMLWLIWVPQGRDRRDSCFMMSRSDWSAVMMGFIGHDVSTIQLFCRFSVLVWTLWSSGISPVCCWCFMILSALNSCYADFLSEYGCNGVMMTYIVIWVACFMIACDTCSEVVMGIGHDLDRVPSWQKSHSCRCYMAGTCFMISYMECGAGILSDWSWYGMCQ